MGHDNASKGMAERTAKEAARHNQGKCRRNAKQRTAKQKQEEEGSFRRLIRWLQAEWEALQSELPESHVRHERGADSGKLDDTSGTQNEQDQQFKIFLRNFTRFGGA
jgi:hypothetical protein